MGDQSANQNLSESMLCEDISRGRERVQVRVLSTNTTIPVPDFVYVTRSVLPCSQSSSSDSDGDCASPEMEGQRTGFCETEITDDKHVQELEGCGCCGDSCLDCKECLCAAMTRGFAYDADGCCVWLRHQTPAPTSTSTSTATARSNHNSVLQPQPIIECGDACLCNPQTCGNRIVQRGVRLELQVMWTGPARNFGVRCTSKIPAGTFVAEYTGEIVPSNRMQPSSGEESTLHYPPPMVYTMAVCESVVGGVVRVNIDATKFGCVSRFLNHSCDGNLSVCIVRANTSLPRVAFFAKREIQPFEELTFHYGESGGDKPPQLSTVVCACGAENCVGFLPRLDLA